MNDMKYMVFCIILHNDTLLNVTYYCSFTFLQPTNLKDVLGVAALASIKDYFGGICGVSGSNLGMSSYSADDEGVVHPLSYLVTAHEFGHNWGSEHDPDSPSDNLPKEGGTDGNFIMFPSFDDHSRVISFMRLLFSISVPNYVFIS